MAFQLPNLDYAYDALEPHIDAKTMEVHHTKHHQTYTDKANAALSDFPDWQGKSTGEILTHLDAFPEPDRSAIRNNVGGYCNHNFFWKILSPAGGGEPVGTLAKAITQTFGSFEEFKKEFTAKALSQFGSGWAWLVLKDGKLSVISTSNQDSPLTLGYKRILGIDVWEHAYYLKFQNRRPEYIEAFWNVINWNQAEEWYREGGV